MTNLCLMFTIVLPSFGTTFNEKNFLTSHSITLVEVETILFVFCCCCFFCFVFRELFHYNNAKGVIYINRIKI